MLCVRCNQPIKGNYGSVCEDCWAARQQRIDWTNTSRAKLESPHDDLEERTVRGLRPLVGELKDRFAAEKNPRQYPRRK